MSYSASPSISRHAQFNTVPFGQRRQFQSKKYCMSGIPLSDVAEHALPAGFSRL